MSELQSHNDQSPIPPPVHIPRHQYPQYSPLSQPPTASMADNIPILSLYFWALWFAIQILRGYHVWSFIYFQHTTPIPTNSSKPHFLSDPFSIPSAFSPLLMRQAYSYGAIFLSFVSNFLGCHSHVMLFYTPKMSAVLLCLFISF